MAMRKSWATVQWMLALSLLGAAFRIEMPVRAEAIGNLEPSIEAMQDEDLEPETQLTAAPEEESDFAAVEPVALPLSEMEQPATTVESWMAQIEAALVQITGVRIEATETGLQVVLETENGSLTVPQTRAVGNAVIADIENATIAEDFSQTEPIEEIALVSVTQLPDNRVRVAITGTAAPPVAEVRLDDQGLVLGVAIGQAGTGAADEAIQVTVTGEEGYNPSRASTATRTDTALRDTPVSIQVIPREVIEDQGVNRLQDAVRNNAPGVTAAVGLNQSFVIRGFQQNSNLRNGFRTSSGNAPIDLDLADIEQIEVLRGPASVLFGQLQPGGVVNTVTEQPLREPYYNLQFTGGQFSFYRPELDFSGPLTDNGELRYRLNAAYQNYGSFRDFSDRERFFVAPVLQWDISENTTLTLDFSYTYTNSVVNAGVVALSDGSLVLPINRALFYPSLDNFTEEQYQASYRLEHSFSDDWQLRSGFSFSQRLEDGATSFNGSLTDDRFLSLFYNDGEFLLEDYQLQTDLIGKFATGSIQHQLLIGFDLARAVNLFRGRDPIQPVPPIDIFNPNYDVAAPDTQPGFFNTTFTDSLGVYLQDQIDITDSLHLLVGGRFDLTEQYGNTLGTNSSQTDTAFSPRLGIVYQPIEPISLYASYSQSFTPIIGRSRTRSTFEPERVTQYEIGIKADISNSLSATLAAFEITKTNVQTPDPVDPNFSVQVGEQRSRGIELIVQGEILPGWNIIGGYAYTDARVTEDNNTPEGDFLLSVPENAANLWTTYEIQSGEFQGLGLGFGLVFVGERQGDFPNSNFQIPSYARVDAALFYRRDNWRAAINVNNLFDTEYYESASSRTVVYPGAPINVTASLSYTF